MIREQDAELLKFLIEQGFDINSRFTKLLTNGNLLFLAIKLNASDMIEPILQAGIDVNELVEGSSILAIAIESGRLEAIKLLLKYHPDIEAVLEKYSKGNLEVLRKKNKKEYTIAK